MKPQEQLTQTQKPQLFRHFLGDDYKKLPLEIRQFHEHSDQVWQGTAKITGDSNIILKLLRKLNGLPAMNPEVPVTISVRYHNNTEIWQRQFGANHFTSIMGFDEKKQLLFEKVGMLRFYFKLELREDEDEDASANANANSDAQTNSKIFSYWDFQYLTVLGCKIPRFLSPIFIGKESVSLQNTYQFKAHVRLPFLGVLVDYEGKLLPPSSLSNIEF
ncbi:DUF4166 domain-containing protein [Ignatzschineria sp. LJL83]